MALPGVNGKAGGAGKKAMISRSNVYFEGGNDS